MYAGESRVSSMAAPVDPNGPVDQQNSKAEQGSADSGPALEVIQLANGETIWSVFMSARVILHCRSNTLSGLLSMVSEMPTMNLFTPVVPVLHRSIPLVSLEAMVVRFLRRSTVVLGRRAAPFPSPPRRNLSKGRYVLRQRCVFYHQTLFPTSPLLTSVAKKVFHSSSAQIGRLIESLSQGVDSGSFNILPNTGRGPGHSASSSLSTNDINWTVEERLDRMLGAINNSNNS
jgi:serine/arginine repetitive matrix protein 2